MHSVRFELTRVAPADLESAALDRSAINALSVSLGSIYLFNINIASHFSISLILLPR